MVGPAQAAYNPYTNSVILKIGATITENVLPEELIHAGQNRIYPKGIAQYSGRVGTPNIEFEAKLTQDLILYINALPFGLGEGENNAIEYSQWLIKLCGDVNSPTFPSMDSVLTISQDGNGYYDMMREFKSKAYQYNYEIIDTLKPLYIKYTSKNYGK